MEDGFNFKLETELENICLVLLKRNVCSHAYAMDLVNLYKGVGPRILFKIIKEMISTERILRDILLGFEAKQIQQLDIAKHEISTYQDTEDLT